MNNSAFLYLLNTVHGFLIIIFVARLLLELVSVPIQNPICSFVLRATQKVVNPLQVFLPSIKRFNLAVLVIILLLNIANIYLLNWLSTNISLTAISVITTTVLHLLPLQLLNFLFWSIIINVVFSWLPNASFHPLAQIVSSICRPVLQPIQKMMPSSSGLDFSPIIILLILGFLERLFQ